MVEYKVYNFDSESDRKAACDEYSHCMQNNLSSSSVERMTILDEIANNAGFRFHMTNKVQYMQPHTLTTPRFELIQIEKDRDFADAVESIPVNGEGLEQ